MRYLFAVLLVLSLLFSAASSEGRDESSLYVRKIDSLPENFIMGMDVSSVIALENSGVKYYDHLGNERDLFEILKGNGVNYIRVRVWNDPYTEDGRSYGGGNNDIQTALEIGKRATRAGMRLLVDFHYSDFWADPSKQQTPKAWEGMKIAEKAEKLYEYTYDCLTLLKNEGVDVGMVQLGNETNGKMSGEKIWMNIYKLMNAGSKAVRAVDPSILIAVHFTNPESYDSFLSYAFKLDYYSLDYDIFATSYYPYWHGTLDNLKKVLGDIQATYGKSVMVAETSYAYTTEDTDFSGNTVSDSSSIEKSFPFTVQGQANHTASVIQAMTDIGGIGVFYWEGAWITVGGDSYEENSAKWEAYGSGWASKAAGEYDPNDAGIYYGGCACDNQAMFDASGHALESIKVFKLVREGNAVPVIPDAIEDTYLTFDLNGEICFPETVNAVMNDASTRQVPVVWKDIDEKALRTGGVKDYVFTGIADGMQAMCYVSMVEYNYVKNYSFEEDDTGMWTTVNLSSTEQLYPETKKADAKTGVRHYHFYSAKGNSTEFTLEQKIEALPEGIYRYEISIQGGDGGETNIYSYVKRNGEIIHTAPSKITSYNSWHTPVIEGIEVAAGDEITIGIYVKCAGAGAWGKIDDAKLNSSK